MGFPENHFRSGENRPRMLKDFLVEDSNSSCSSSGFRLFSRKPLDHSNIRTLIERELNMAKRPSAPKKESSRPRYSIFSKTYTFQSVVKAFKSIHVATVKTPSVLTRTLSRRLSKKSSSRNMAAASEGITHPVKVKDIIRWASSRDLADNESTPLDCATTTTSGGSSAGSSWSDSDFSATSEYSPPWHGKGYLPCVGDRTRTPAATCAKVGPKEDENQQQNSPISVIEFNDFQVDGEEEEDSSSPVDQSFANMERMKHKLMGKLRRFESLAKLGPLGHWKSMDESTSSEEEEEDQGEETNSELEDDESNVVEKKAWKLLNQVRCANPQGTLQDGVNKLLLDFFGQELASREHAQFTSGRLDEVEEILVNRARAWIKGDYGRWMGWEVVEKRKDYVKDMDMGVANRWSNFEEEQEEIAFVVGDDTVSILVDDLLLDLLLDSCNIN